MGLLSPASSACEETASGKVWSEQPLFGQLARQQARIASEDVDAALAEQRVVGGRLGEILCKRGLLTRSQVREILAAQARHTVQALEQISSGPRFPYPTFLSLVMPAYNEQGVIEDTLDAAMAILPELVERFEVVVVDDGSRDRTGEIVASYGEREPGVRLVSHSQNRGYGGAVTSGLRAAAGDHVAFTDSDGQFSFLDLAQLLARRPGCDVVVGYRHRRADHWIRLVNAWGWNRLIRLVLGVRIRDLDCAFKLFPRQVIDQLDLTAGGAAINAEIMVQCVRGGLRIRETPVRHYPRYSGMPTGAARKVILRAFRELPPLWWRYRAGAARPLFRGVAAEPLPAILRNGTPAEGPATNGYYQHGANGFHLNGNKAVHANGTSFMEHGAPVAPDATPLPDSLTARIPSGLNSNGSAAALPPV
jgi:hypothetical protein